VLAHSPTPFSARGCILAQGTGSVSCPPDFPVKSTLYTDFDDQRTCTCPCTGAGCTGGSIQYFSQPGCTGSVATEPLEACHAGGLDRSKPSNPERP
jgi:hypothetical protein